MKKKHLLFLSLLSAVLLTVGWPVNGFSAFLFVALVPMFIIEDYIFNNRDDFSGFSIFFYTYPGFLIWNVLTTWWVWNSTPAAIAAWTLNAMFMSIVFWAYHFIRKEIYGTNKGYFVLPFVWIAFEFLHLNWKITWTWLNLGNGFGNQTHWIQWYEYTGALGGSLWILIVNILIFLAIKSMQAGNKRNFIINSVSVLLLILIPIFISYLIYYEYTENKNPVRVVVCQQNLDPYSEQYSTPPTEVAKIITGLSDEVLDDSVCFVVAPESTIQDYLWEDKLDKSRALKILQEYVIEHPRVNIVIGASTYKKYEEKENRAATARYSEINGFYYESYNTAFLIDTTGELQRHHKMKLTPGVEYMPSWGFLDQIAIDLGGSVGSLGIDDEQILLIVDTVKIAPIICYESVFGEFCGDYAKKGAQVFFLITNDGWWGDTPGYKQHLLFSPLRAIETRRWVVQSANTGTSAFIDQRGDIHQPTGYWVRTVIKQDVNLNSELTFYAVSGDYIGRISAFLAVLLLLISTSFSLKRKTKELR
jgi:apolipoprotein N-acyltransferase